MSLEQIHAWLWLLMGAFLWLVALRAVITLKDAWFDRDWRSAVWAIVGFVGALLAGAIVMAMGMDGPLFSD